MSHVPGIAVTLGPCDDMRAEVFVRLTAPPGPVVARLEGMLVGPECRWATTLPATARLMDLGPRPDGAADDAVAGRAVLTEPAFWTPDLPNLYRLEVRAVRDGAVTATHEVRIGLRRLGVRGRSFRLDGRRWVPRGVKVDAASFDAAALRREAATAIVVNPDEPLCGRADADGVATIAVIDGAESLEARIGRIADWAIHPAVMLALLPPGTSAVECEAIARGVRGCKGTLLLGWWVDGATPPPPLPAGVDWLAVAVGDGEGPHPAWRDAAPAVPLVACGGGGGRAGCDVLQARLAAWLVSGGGPLPWDWAGYAVW